MTRVIARDLDSFYLQVSNTLLHSAKHGDGSTNLIIGSKRSRWVDSVLIWDESSIISQAIRLAVVGHEQYGHLIILSLLNCGGQGMV